MKLMKRATALFLCFLMLTNGPISAFATEGTDDVVVETTTTTETVETCEECGGSDAHTETCSFNIVAPLTTEAPDETTEPTTTPTVVTEPTVTTGSAISTDPVGCTECNQTEGHLDTCSQYVAPTEETTEPTVSGNDVVACTECGATEGHNADCSQYVDPNACAECKQVDGHADTCSQYEAPVEDIAETDGPQVGDKIWIKHNSYVYKSQSAENGHKLLLNYEVEIVNIITDENGNALWYEFKFTTVGIGEWLIREYKYVQAENTSVEEPEPSEAVDEFACNCGENAPENIADHADSCVRKQYIKTLFDGKTAEEIYADWESYDEATQTDLLNMLQKWDNTKYEELKKLVDEAPEGGKETTVGDISLKVQGVPENVTLDAKTVAPKSWDEAVFEAVGNKKVVFAIDITLNSEDGQWQPAEGETVTVTLDAASLGLSEGERIGILHEHDDTLNDLGICTVTDGKLTFTTNGFSVFYGYTVDFEYDGTWYSIGGGGIILLSELFDALNIEKSAYSASSVEFSNPALLSVSYENIGSYVPEYDWVLRSLEPFNTEEVLTVNFTGGEILQIKVLDANYTALTNGMTLNNGDALNGSISVSGNTTITVNGTVTLNGNITVQKNATLTINGTGTIKRGSSNKGAMFTVANGGTLIVNAITIDGAASWTATNIVNSTRKTLAVSGVQAEHTAIYSAGGATITLNRTTMQNLYTTKYSAAIHALGTVGNKDNIQPSNVTLTNVNVRNCASTSDNSILLLNYSYATLTECKVENNYTGNRYAGVIKAGGPSNFCLLKMNNCTATNNYSSGWGGVILWAANTAYNGTRTEAFITDCTFTNNTARYLGGAISNEAIMTVSGCTITGNTAMSGGGIATFPYTRTEDDATGSNACGLTLGAGNIISNNKAVATGKFKPFSSEGNGADQDAPGSKIDKVIEYTGGGGGVWCYMNKDKWTCSLEIGKGNTIQENNAENMGGGVLVEHVAGTYTELKVTGAQIEENKANQGGGVAVIKATVSIDSGEITENTAVINGGGIYVTSGICNVSGTGSVSDNEAANGGGIYIDNSSLTVSGGVITGNSATGSFNGTTAKDATSGVGGGIYVKTGSFTMSGDFVGLHSNTASVAANDAYASGENTTLILPDVEAMELSGWTGTGKPEGWFADYMGNDEYYPSSVIKVKNEETVNPGRYNFYDEDKVEVDHAAVLSTNTNTYYCLTIGTPHPGYGNLWITKTLNSPAKEDQTFIFEVTGKTRKPETDYTLTVTLVIEKGETTAQVLVANIPDGTYTVTEKEAWSWRYDQTSRQFHPKDGAVISETQFTVAIENPEWVADFTNTRTQPFWLSGDSYCENWWDGTGETKIIKREEHY